jgi:hypothetical protein
MFSQIYEDRVVAFIDILGFRSHIEKSEKDENEFAKIFLATHFMKSEETRKINNDNNYRKATSFSDNIVISYPLDYNMDIVIDIIELQILLTNHGFLLRGGIACGKLYHDESVVFGKAMIDAYELESNIAKYPRIVLSENYYDLLCNYKSNSNLMNTYLIKDIDGFHYLNFLHLNNKHNQNERQDIIASIVKMERQIDDTLANNKKADIRAKMYWLKNYINMCREKYGY